MWKFCIGMVGNTPMLHKDILFLKGGCGRFFNAKVTNFMNY